MNDTNIKEPKSKRNIIICSKQFLQYKTNRLDKDGNEIIQMRSIGWLSKMKINIRFLDEAHQGGSTELSKKILKKYGKNSSTVYMTATYFKPTISFEIPRENIFTWDLEDIVLCKDYIENYDRLVEKHSEGLIQIFNKYSDKTIMNEYKRYPDLHILTDEFKIEFVNKVIRETRNNNYGYSTSSSLLLCQDEEGNIMEEFQNNEKALNIFYKIFGKISDLGIPDSKYSNFFMKKIEDKCKEKGSRFSSNMNEPIVIMCFLPQNNINELSNTVKKLLKKNNIVSEYDIVIANSKVTNNPKNLISDSVIKAKHQNKKGVLVLSGKTM